jgi:four helix bundle protein
MKKKFEFEKLDVYQKSIKYIDKIYRITTKFPKSEQFGLSNQLRRCTTSIALNVAEGYGRYHKKSKNQFYNFARSSAHECIPI